MNELKAYTEEEIAEQQRLYDEVFTPVWESEGQYCRAGGGQYEKSFAWWAFKHQQSKVDELQNDVSIILASHKRMSVGLLQQQDKIEKLIKERDELQKRVDESLRILVDIKKKGLIGTQYSIFDLEQALKGGGE